MRRAKKGPHRGARKGEGSGDHFWNDEDGSGATEIAGDKQKNQDYQILKSNMNEIRTQEMKLFDLIKKVRIDIIIILCETRADSQPRQQ